MIAKAVKKRMVGKGIATFRKKDKEKLTKKASDLKIQNLKIKKSRPDRERGYQKPSKPYEYYDLKGFMFLG